MTVPLPILNSGQCEPFKASIHGAALGLCALMGLYNAAAWINRRERHLAINAIVYGLAVAFEQRHVAHHLNSCRAQLHRAAEAAALTIAPPPAIAPSIRDGSEFPGLAPWDVGIVDPQNVGPWGDARIWDRPAAQSAL